MQEISFLSAEVKKRNIILVILFAVIIPACMSTWGLTESSEARYAEISKEMYNSDDYLHPTYLGIYHYHKPPLTYYITAAGYFIFGINEMGARFFLIISLLFQLWFVYKICFLFYKNKEIALSALLIYFSFPIVQAASKNLTTDSYLTTFIFAAIFFFLQYKVQLKIYALYLFYLCCGLAFLTKGPVGLLPEGLFALFYNWLFPKTIAKAIHRYTAFLLGLVISFSWFIVLVITTPGLFHYFVKYQLVDRVASDSFNRSKPWWYYFIMMPLLALPAIVYFFDYLRTAIIKLKITRSVKLPVPAWCLIISLMVFSLSSSKLVFYVMPLYLFIAMLSAKHLFTMQPIIIKKTEAILAGFFCLVLVAVIVSCFIKLPFIIPQLPVFVICIAGLSLLLYLYFKKNLLLFLKGPMITATGIAILTCILPPVMNANELKINSVKPLALFINDRSVDNTKINIVVYNYLLPSLAFYTGKNIITVDNGNAVAHREVQFEPGSNYQKRNYFRMQDKEEKKDLSLMLEGKENFIITRKQDDIPDSLSFIKKNLQHRFAIDKWIIYY